ncbi:MAG TPA: hypothetical protein VF524_05550 [Polyangia bacterium]
MTLTLRMFTTSCAAMIGAACVLVAGCSNEVVEVQTATVTVVADGGSAGGAGSSVTGGEFVEPDQIPCVNRPPNGRICAPPSRPLCGEPAAPLNGTVRTAKLRQSVTATYACANGFNLIGDALRTCQTNGAWSGSSPTCVFARAGTSCGGCGGSYNGDGTCSIDTPANLGSACDIGLGKGACASGGTIVCGGACQAADPAVGDATAWHLEPTPAGSWDWDCDGAVTTTLQPSPVPADCSTFADSEACQAAPVVEYVAEDAPCGQQATLFIRECDWKTLGPTCLNTPASHRVVFQQCR